MFRIFIKLQFHFDKLSFTIFDFFYNPKQLITKNMHHDQTKSTPLAFF